MNLKKTALYVLSSQYTIVVLLKAVNVQVVNLAPILQCTSKVYQSEELSASLLFKGESTRLMNK